MIPFHIGCVYPKQYLFLKKLDDSTFQWFKVSSSFESEKGTPCMGETSSSAIKAAYKLWKDHYFRLLHCGFCYSLPERDEVGWNAFFWQMAKSYSSLNGHYFDEEVGHLCYVDFASQEALSIWRKIR